MRLERGIGWSLGGLDLSGIDHNGVDWWVKDVQGWDSPPSSTLGVIQNQFADGGHIGPAFLEPHPMVIVGVASVPEMPMRESRALIKAAMAEFVSCIPVRFPAPLALADGGELVHRMVIQEGQPDVRLTSDYRFTFSVQVVAPKARKLGGDGSAPYQSSATAYLPSSVGGLQLPVMAPFGIGATVIGNSVTVTARGNARPPVLVRINGPAVQPIIRDDQGGQMVLDISLDAGQWLDVDLDARTIKINSQVSRRNVLRGPWITPRAGMTLSLDAAVYDPLTSMTVFWTDASY